MLIKNLLTTAANSRQHRNARSPRSLRFLALLLSMSATMLITVGTNAAPLVKDYTTSNVEVSASFADQQVPSTFVVPITVGDITADGIIAFQFDLVYDPRVIAPTGPNFGCSTNDTLAGAAGLTADCNITTDGTLRISAYGAYPMTGEGPILNVIFTTTAGAEVGNVSRLSFENVFFFGSGGQVETDTHNGQITLIASEGTPDPTDSIHP